MASIYTLTGEAITAGLQGSSVCDEAIIAARQQARQRGEDVYLSDDDGDWIVSPDGSVAEADGELVAEADGEL